jgi:hypothetical protein
MTHWQLDHVQIAAPPGCEEEARQYFGRLLELPEIPKQGETRRTGGVWFRTGQHEIHVGVEAGFVPARKAHVALYSADESRLTSLANRLSSAGYPVRWDERLPGIRRFFTDDPWGNRFEFLTRTRSE